MSFLLNIDTATENAIISISREKIVLEYVVSQDQKDQASFLQPAIKQLLDKTGLIISRLNAVAVSAGPGSYTGLRVGMASAKGLCYALNIPLITLSTLEIMALSAIKQVEDPDAFYCPVIDARRMEVFTAIYDHALNEVMKPCSMILDGDAYKEAYKNIFQKKAYFSGSGSGKIKNALQNKTAIIINNDPLPDAMAELSYKNFSENNFADIAYASPFYLKEFYTVSPPRKT